MTGRVQCPPAVIKLLEDRHPGRANSTFRYAVKAAVRIVLEHERTGAIAIPVTGKPQSDTLNLVSRVLAEIRCTCPQECQRHQERKAP